jgi:hypothetical protein
MGACRYCIRNGAEIAITPANLALEGRVVGPKPLTRCPASLFHPSSPGIRDTGRFRYP